MGFVDHLPMGIGRRIKAEMVKRYFGNSVDFAVNVEGDRRIRRAKRQARGESFDQGLRTSYGRDWVSRLPGIAFEPAAFAKVRSAAIAALDDPALSPCNYNAGNQAELQGIPRDVIKHDYRRATTNVRAAIPDAPALLHADLVHAIRSSIGSNFFLDGVYVKRNYHVEPEICAQYDLLSDRWHFDHQYPDGFSLFVNLGDFGREHGPTQWINRPDSLRMLRLGYDADERIRSRSGGLPEGTIESCPSFDSLVGPAGSIALMHTSYCLHASGIPASPDIHRDTLCFTFRPSPRMSLTWPD
jgi:hypothetical protein